MKRTVKLCQRAPSRQPQDIRTSGHQGLSKIKKQRPVTRHIRSTIRLNGSPGVRTQDVSLSDVRPNTRRGGSPGVKNPDPLISISVWM